MQFFGFSKLNIVLPCPIHVGQMYTSVVIWHVSESPCYIGLIDTNYNKILNLKCPCFMFYCCALKKLKWPQAAFHWFLRTYPGVYFSLSPFVCYDIFPLWNNIGMACEHLRVVLLYNNACEFKILMKIPMFCLSNSIYPLKLDLC